MEGLFENKALLIMLGGTQVVTFLAASGQSPDLNEVRDYAAPRLFSRDCAYALNRCVASLSTADGNSDGMANRRVQPAADGSAGCRLPRIDGTGCASEDAVSTSEGASLRDAMNAQCRFSALNA